MEPRLIVVPQLPVLMRYQEWWPRFIKANMRKHFKEVLFLGRTVPTKARHGSFSDHEESVANEAIQTNQILRLGIRQDDVILHCDLSYPGVFHNVLPLLPRCRRAVFCHATSLNRYDHFSSVRAEKWPIEKAHARLYDKVLVATKYHAEKLNLPNVVRMRALPHPPELGIVAGTDLRSTREMCRVSRATTQKVTQSVEKKLYKLTRHRVHAGSFTNWKDYFTFLAQSRFMIVTSKEETYGYQVVDAVLAGCIPIAPNAYSYPELLPERFLYSNTGSPFDRALAIAETMERNRGEPARLLPACNQAAKHFWNKLAVELTNWN